MRSTVRRLGLAIALSPLSLGCGATQSAPPSTAANPCLVDLTYTYDESTVYWPTSPSKFEKETLSYGTTPGGFFYSSFAIATPEHGGTHLDAPIHFVEGQATVDAVPLERLIAPAVVVDISEAATADADALLTVEDLEAFEREHGAIEPGTIVLIRTGWGRYWPDPKRYLGSDVPGDASNLHFPGVSEEAARALVERQVASVGIDTASIDYGPSTDFLAHRVLGEAGIPIFENVAALDRLPARGAQVYALPMKIGGGSGAPTRIIAFVPAAECSGR